MIGEHVDYLGGVVLPAAVDRFTEVSGLSVEMGTEEFVEGGENRFIQKYPTRAKYPELVLKRGLHRERVDERGHLVGDATDEVPMRAMWKHYRSLMEDRR